MSKENTATVYGLDKGAYLINKQPQLINDRHLEGELQCSEMYFKNTKEYIRRAQADSVSYCLFTIITNKDK